MKNLKSITWLVFTLLLTLQLSADSFQDWGFKGDISILTTPEGADITASQSEVNVPILVRLNKEIFNFSEPQENGADIRFSLNGNSLKYSIESWDKTNSRALIWVLIPKIEGNKIISLNMHWGNNKVKSESKPEELFGLKNNFMTVNHMDSDHDVLKLLNFDVKGTKIVEGLIGKSRKFVSGDVMRAPQNITFFPKKKESHSTSIWYKASQKGGDIVGWGSESRQGKIVMQLKTPGPHIRVDAWFSRGGIKTKQNLPLNKWIHVVHTHTDKETLIYVNGQLHSKSGGRGTSMNIPEKSKMTIGGWGRQSVFEGHIDEVRLANIARSSTWIKLQYENQRPMQRLVGHLKQPGNTFSVSKKELTINEGEMSRISANAGGADKVYWSLVSDGKREIVAVDRLVYEFNAGRVSKDVNKLLEFNAVYGREVKKILIPVTIKEKISDPSFTLKYPVKWDGRSIIEIVPEINNLAELKALKADKISYQWTASEIAVTKREHNNKLILTRAHNSGIIKVKLSLSNGGTTISKEVNIKITEPEKDPWVYRQPEKNEKPLNNQFYARNPQNVGLMYCNGFVTQGLQNVFLKVYADDKVYTSVQQRVKNKKYSFKVELKAGLLKYRIELGYLKGDQEKIIYTAKNIVCGDAYLIEGQSNALATDTREKSPTVTNEWVRSYAMRRFYKEGEEQNLWSFPVWKATKKHTSQLGWWGMELAKRLVAQHKVPVFILNAAKGGTRVDQHQREPQNPQDEDTIYGRMLWRLKQAKLTHGIKAVIWHQGESDQGSAGPGGELGWKNYEQYFVDMTAAWKEDIPNIQKYYVFQIRPNACSMGQGNGDMLREKQRNLSRLYSNMDMLSTIGVKPPGGCHYPLVGWAVFADMLQPLIARDFYGFATEKILTAPNLRRAYYTSKSEITLEFDQEVVWADLLVFDLYLDGQSELIKNGKSLGNKLILTLNKPFQAKTISYLKEMSWKAERLLIGKNGIAALTFSNVKIKNK
jgi:hypothetical protein